MPTTLEKRARDCYAKININRGRLKWISTGWDVQLGFGKQTKVKRFFHIFCLQIAVTSRLVVVCCWHKSQSAVDEELCATQQQEKLEILSSRQDQSSFAPARVDRANILELFIEFTNSSRSSCTNVIDLLRPADIVDYYAKISIEISSLDCIKIKLQLTLLRVDE